MLLTKEGRSLAPVARAVTRAKVGPQRLILATLEAAPLPKRLAVVRARRTLPHDLSIFIDLEARLLQVLHDPLGELLARVVGTFERPPLEIAAAGDRKADRASSTDAAKPVGRAAHEHRRRGTRASSTVRFGTQTGS
jgi:hypothetical protein